jgi:hypothetical protein
MAFSSFTERGSRNGQNRQSWRTSSQDLGRKILRSDGATSKSCKSYRTSRLSLLTLFSVALFLLVGQSSAAVVPNARDIALHEFAKRDSTNVTPTCPDELPQPFDQSLGNNFTSTTCPNFFNTFLADNDFQSCYPFSLLLTVSLDSCVFDLTSI